MTTAPSVRPIGYSLMLTIDRGHASSIPPPPQQDRPLDKHKRLGSPGD